MAPTRATLNIHGVSLRRVYNPYADVFIRSNFDSSRGSDAGAGVPLFRFRCDMGGRGLSQQLA